MSEGCIARAHRAPSRAQILRGNMSSAGRPIWNGRIDSGRKLVGEMLLGRHGLSATGAGGLSPGVTIDPACPRA